MKNLLLKTIILMLCLFALLLGTACTEPEAPSAEPPAEVPAEDAWKHQVTNTEILETEHFLDAPDSVVYYDGSFENVVELSDEDAVMLFSAFLELRDDFNGIAPIKGYFDMRVLAEKIKKTGGIEIRYDQRRQYVGDPIEKQMPGGRIYRWYFGAEGPFDALLIIPADERSLIIVPYLDGAYHERIDYYVCFSKQFEGFMAVWNAVLTQ